MFVMGIFIVTLIKFTMPYETHAIKLDLFLKCEHMNGNISCKIRMKKELFQINWNSHLRFLLHFSVLFFHSTFICRHVIEKSLF